jgi:hypothetical protein
LTTVQGLDKAYDPKKILKAFKKVSERFSGSTDEAFESLTAC